MSTFALSNVPEDVVAALEEVAERESLSVYDVAVRELRAALAFRRNSDRLRSVPALAIALEDVVDAVRSGRDR